MKLSVTPMFATVAQSSPVGSKGLGISPIVYAIGSAIGMKLRQTVVFQPPIENPIGYFCGQSMSTYGDPPDNRWYGPAILSATRVLLD